MLILSAKELSGLLLNLSKDDLSNLQDSMVQAMISFSSESRKESQLQIHQPARTHIHTSKDYTTLIMPVSNTATTAVKTVTLVPGRSPNGAITVYSADGDLMGVLNAGEMTAFRTALMTSCVLRSVVSKRTDLAQPLLVVVFGAGKQAEWHIRLVLQTVNVSRVVLVNRSRVRLQEANETFLADLRQTNTHAEFSVLTAEGNNAYEDQLQDILAASDIICGTTPSLTPLFPFSALKSPPKSRLIMLIGSYKPQMHEIDTETLLSGHDGRVLVDSIKDCLIESGEIIDAGIQKEKLVEVGDLFSDTANDITRMGANLVYKCVGFALMDLVMADSILALAKSQKKGTVISDF